ncbi:MAG: peptidase M61, partial [Burkholderiales bacterium]
MLARAGLVARDAYLKMLGKTITQVMHAPGRFKQTLAESSFDAWIKYYRPDENTPNAVVSYYQKGAVVALCLGLLIRQRTNGRRSLDHVMRALWRRFGKTGQGVPEDGIQQIAESVAGVPLKNFFHRALNSTEELPFARLLATMGIEMTLR